MNANEILDLPMQENDANAKTVREYLIALLLALWRERERFDGKRPFSNSLWEFDLYQPLVKARIVRGRTNIDELIQEVDTKKADLIITEAILSLASQIGENK